MHFKERHTAQGISQFTDALCKTHQLAYLKKAGKQDLATLLEVLAASLDPLAKLLEVLATSLDLLARLLEVLATALDPLARLLVAIARIPEAIEKAAYQKRPYLEMLKWKITSIAPEHVLPN